MLTGRRRGDPATNRGRRFPPEPLSPEEARALLEACGSSWAGLRNAALIAILWRAGLRVSEALALEPKDVDLELGTVRVLRGKGDRTRVVGLDPKACAVVHEWLEIRPWVPLSDDLPLFATREGRQVSAGYVRELLRRLATKAGILKRVHPHGLRHTMATEMRREGVDIVLIQRQLGHTNLHTTQTYLAHVAPEEVFEAVRQRSW